MIYVHLTDEQRAELRQVSRQAVGRVAAHGVAVEPGYSVPQIAAIHDCGMDGVRTWLHRYEQAGIAGLEDEPRSGRPPKDPRAVDAQPPDCSGHVPRCWTVALLTVFLAVRFRLHLSAASGRRYLKASGWRGARPRLAPANLLGKKRDPEAARGAAHLLFLDECDLHLLPRAMWMKGPRVGVPTPGTNARHAFFGALNAVRGTWHSTDHPRKRAVHFVAFRQHLADAYPMGRLILVMDNVRMHDAKVVRAWLADHPRVHVLWLPRYAAHDAKPAERLWGLMKDKVAANRLAGCIDDLVAAARRFFADLAPHPVPLPKAA